MKHYPLPSPFLPHHAEELRNQATADEQISKLRTLISSEPQVAAQLIGTPKAKSWGEIWSKSQFGLIKRPQQSLNWLAAIAMIYKDTLSAHFKLKRAVENASLFGRWVDALRHLDEHQSAVGHTLWNLGWRLTIAEESIGPTGRHRLLSTLLAGNSNQAVNFFAAAFSLNSDKSMPDDHCRKAIQERIKQQPVAIHTLLEIILIEQNLTDLNPSNAFPFLELLPIVDRIEVFLKCTLLANSFRSDDAHRCNRALSRIVDLTEDESLLAFYESLNSQAEIAVTSTNSELIAAWDAYICSDYATCKSISQEIIKNNPDIIAAHELFVKSQMYLGQVVPLPQQTPSPIQSLHSHLTTLYLRDSATDEALASIRRFASQFRIFALSSSLRSLCEQHLADSPDPKLLRLGGYAAGCHGPRNHELGFSSSQHCEYLNRLKAAFGSKLSINFFLEAAIGPPHIPDPQMALIPDVRRAFFFGLGAFKRGDLQASSDHLNQFLSYRTKQGETQFSPLSPLATEEARRALIQVYLINGDTINLLETIVRNLLDKSPTSRRMQFSRIFRSIQPIPTEAYSHPGYPILARQACDDPHQISFALRDFLDAHEIERPSQLILKWTDEPERLGLLFLNVCNIDVIDSLVSLETVESVEEERLKLLRWIANFCTAFPRLAENEILRITQQAELRDALASVDHSRVVLNMPSLRESEHARLSEVYFSYRAQEELLIVDTGRQIRGAIDEAKKEGYGVILFGSNKDLQRTFFDIFRVVRDLFLKNPQFGIEACLSLRIRHGFIVEHIRRPLVALRLALKDRSSDENNTEEFWCEKLQLDSGHPNIGAILEIMCDLTNQIDGIAYNVKDNWIQCRTEQRQSEALFDFSFSDRDLLAILMTQNNNFATLDIFLDWIFDILLRRTRDNLQKVRDRINSDFQQEIYSAIELAISKASILESSDTLVPFRNTLNTCRQQAEIMTDELRRWFDESRSALMGDVDFSIVANTAAGMAERLNPQFKGRFSIDDSRSDCRLKGRYFTSLVHIVIFLLDNAVRYSAVSRDLFQVRIAVFVLEGRITIRVRNLMRDAKSAAVAAKVINERVAELHNNLDGAKVIREGGSGFAKILVAIGYEFKGRDHVIQANKDNDWLEVFVNWKGGWS